MPAVPAEVGAPDAVDICKAPAVDTLNLLAPPTCKSSHRLVPVGAAVIVGLTFNAVKFPLLPEALMVGAMLCATKDVEPDAGEKVHTSEMFVCRPDEVVP